MADDKRHLLGKMRPNLQVLERRRFPRAAVDLKVKLGFTSVDSFLTAHARDISRGGLLLAVVGETAADTFQPGQVITLKVSLGGERFIEAKARIVRVLTPETVGASAGLAVEFVDLDQFSAQLIDATVDEQLVLEPE